MVDQLYAFLFYYFLLSSLARFVFVLIKSQWSTGPQAELQVRALAKYGSITDVLALALVALLYSGTISLVINDFIFFVGSFTVVWDIQSLAFLCFAIGIIAIINRFAVVYLYRDPFYFKFFSLIYLLQFALCLLILTRGNESIFVGWEFLGLSSILLIAFYEYRTSVLKSALTILAIYKLADILFYSALIYASTSDVHNYDQFNNWTFAHVVLLACLIKSSVFPWFWLPRAVEGPTQSTAVFYGGLATHVPIFVFINVWQAQTTDMGYLNYLFIALIIGSILASSMMSQRMNDAKNAIAYACITQLGIIYLEVILGYPNLALAHCILHGFYRTFEFLKAPSLIHERLRLEQDLENPHAHQMGIFGWLPKAWRQWLYQLTYREFILYRLSLRMIENFMGLYSSHISMRVLTSLLGYSFLFVVITNGLIYVATDQIDARDLALILCAYAFSILAILNKYNPVTFFASLSFSVTALMGTLFNKYTPLSEWQLYLNLGVLLVALLVLVGLLIKLKVLVSNKVNYAGSLHISETTNLVIFILGLSVVAMPCLGTYYIWHYLEHALVQNYPALIISCYILMGLNTILFFRFYFANYMGKHDVIRQIMASRRV